LENFYYHPDEFRLVSVADETAQIYLRNLLREYQSAPKSRRQEVLKPYIRAWFEHDDASEKFEDTVHGLLPKLEGRGYFELRSLRLQYADAAGASFPYKPVADLYGAGLVHAKPDNLRGITSQNLAKWGTSFEEAFEVAVNNLREISGGKFEQRAPGVLRSPWRDNSDGARILLTDLIEQQMVVGNPVVMIPNWDTLLITGSEDDEGLSHLARLAEAALKRPHAVNAIALQLKSGAWVPFLPPIDHPQHWRFKLMDLESRALDYHSQMQVLAKRDHRLFVSVYMLAWYKQLRMYQSFCEWTEGVDSFLPVTDHVGLFRPRARGEREYLGVYAWEDVVRVAGDLMETTDLFPQRYRVRGFPTEQQLRDLGYKGSRVVTRVNS
jgi:hypothetical protein